MLQQGWSSSSKGLITHTGSVHTSYKEAQYVSWLSVSCKLSLWLIIELKFPVPSVDSQVIVFPKPPPKQWDLTKYPPKQTNKKQTNKNPRYNIFLVVNALNALCYQNVWVSIFDKLYLNWPFLFTFYIALHLFLQKCYTSLHKQVDQTQRHGKSSLVSNLITEIKIRPVCQ